MIDGKPITYWIARLSAKDHEARLESVRCLWNAAQSKPDSVAAAVPALARVAKTDEGEVQRTAIRALGDMGTHAKEANVVLRELARTSTDKASKYLATRGLALVGDVDDAMPLFISIIDAPRADIDLTIDVCELLAKIGPPAKAAVPTLRRNVKTGPVDVCRSASIALCGILKTEAIADLLDAVDSPSAVVRASAVEALGRMGPSASPTVRKLSDLLLSDQDRSVRIACARALAEIGQSSHLVIESLQKGVKDRDLMVCINSAASLVVLGHSSPECIDTLRRLLRHQDAKVREEVAFSLSRCVKRETDVLIPDLIRSLRDRHEDVVTPRLAAKALGRIGRGAVEPLISVLWELDLESHFWAALALEQIGPEGGSAVPVLIEVLKRRDRYVKAAQLPGGEENFTILAIPGAALSALSRVVGPKDVLAVPYLADALTQENELLRLRAVEGLGRIGYPARSTISQLERLLDDPDPSVRAAASEAVRIMKKKQ